MPEEGAPAYHDGDGGTWQFGTSGFGSSGDDDRKVRHGSVVDAGAFESIQGAIDFAEERGYQSVFVPQGTYEEEITVHEGIAVFSSHRRGVKIEPADGPAVTLKRQSSLQQIHVLPDESQALAVKMIGNAANVRDCHIFRPIRVEADFCSVRDSFLTNRRIEFASGTQYGLVDGDVLAGTINDKGDNTVGSNSTI